MKKDYKKKIMALFIACSVLGAPNLAKADVYTMGDVVRATKTVNMRLDSSTDSIKIGSIPQGEEAYRILSCDNDWDVVNYDGQIGFVSRDYLTYSMDSMKSISEHEQHRDIALTTSKLNFRLEPSLDGKKLDTLAKGSEVEVLAQTDDGWLLINYGGTLGYVSAEYTISVSDLVNKQLEGYYFDELSVQKVVYAKSGLNIRSGASTEYDKIGYLNKYESVRVLKDLGDWYLVLTNDYNVGFISKEYTRTLEDVFVIVDLSEQKLYLYNDNELVLSTPVTTGKNSSPTREGRFEIYAKQKDRYLTGDGYRSFVSYWMPFDGGIGLHDASWRKNFGGEIYKKSGSHGCVNMPPSITDDIFEQVSVGTDVLVHK